MPRVPLPQGVEDDAHNRVAGLFDLLEKVGINKTHIVLEIGTARGVSTMALAEKAGLVITIDSYGIDHVWRHDFMRNTKGISNIAAINSDYADTSLPERFFDMVYIDAIHNYDNVKHDIYKSLPLVRPGGWIAGHDYIDRPEYNFGVIQAVNEIFGRPEHVSKDTSWAVKVNRQ